MDKQKIVGDINYDIDRGIYDQFPILRERLSHISHKLFTSIYVINDDSQLSVGEIKTLVENDYIKKEEL